MAGYDYNHAEVRDDNVQGDYAYGPLKIYKILVRRLLKLRMEVFLCKARSVQI